MIQSIITLFLFTVITSCISTQQTTIGSKAEHKNYQMYNMKRKKASINHVIFGHITSIEDNKSIKIGVIKINKDIIHVDTNGYYHHNIISGQYKLLARSIGYNDVETKRLRIRQGDSLQINFQLPPGPPITHEMP